jgi:hypothetical protein
MNVRPGSPLIENRTEGGRERERKRNKELLL